MSTTTYEITEMKLDFYPIRGDTSVSIPTQNATYNDELDAYVFEIDLDKISELDAAKGTEFSLQIVGTAKMTIEDEYDTQIVIMQVPYNMADIVLFRELEFITDRSQKDIDEALELQQRWYQEAMDPESLAKWNAGLKGCLNESTISTIQTKLFFIIVEYLQSRYSGVSFPLVNFYSEIMSGSHYLTASGFETMHDYLDLIIIQTWYNNLATNYEKSRFNANKDLYYANIPPALPYNYFEHWNDIEKLLRMFFKTLIYDEYSYRNAAIVPYTPEPVAYYDFIFMRSTPEAYAADEMDDEGIGLI